MRVAVGAIPISDDNAVGYPFGTRLQSAANVSPPLACSEQ